MINYILFPPIIFVVSFLFIWLFSKATECLMPAADDTDKNEKESVYACGEEYEGVKAEPDYRTFFPFAVFFTIMHVAALMIATLASANTSAVMGLAIFYLILVSIVLAILYRK